MQANEILHHKLTLNGYLSQFTGQTMEQMTKDTDRDFFMSPQVVLCSPIMIAFAPPHVLQGVVTSLDPALSRG